MIGSTTKHLPAAGLAALFLLIAWPLAAGRQADGTSDKPDFETQIRPILEARCFDCHGPDLQRGDIRLDTLDPDLVNGGDAEGWHTALDMIESGEMPPRRAEPPTDDERRLVVAWIRASLEEAARAQAGERRSVLRRLNKVQYGYTLQDLLGLPIEFGRVLPDDGKSEMGFTNNGEVLISSPLHIDYYQQIAREALEEAIQVGPAPVPTRYRVTFGKGRGRGLVAGHTGGYQSVPLSTDDFTVDVLGPDGEPRTAADDKEAKALDHMRRRVSIGLRGSAQSRFRAVDEGMLLYAALPHREKVPKAWQGPSPNLKVELQRCFPEEGSFAMRVRASRGYLFQSQERLLLELEDPLALSALVGPSAAVATLPGARVLSAVDSDERKNLVLHGDVLAPDELTAPASARFQLDQAEGGYYQVDLVHPAVEPDAMPSVRLSLNNLTLDRRFELTDDQLRHPRVVSALGAAYLPPGKHDLKIGGPFFVGFSQLVLTPIGEDHPAVASVIRESDALAASLEDKVPSIRCLVGTRTDDGMDYKTFGQPQEVTAALGSPETYTFVGQLDNLPVPEPESGDTEILSGILLIGLWNDHLVKSGSEPGPPLLVESIELEAPFYPEWPPPTHTAIFFDSPHRDDPEVYTHEVLERFLTRAFRRPPAEAELERYLAFWREVRGDFEVYEHGVREVLVAILCSPNFLFLAEPTEGAAADDLPQAAVATRLSYFLWNSPPDAELTDLARRGELLDQLDAQVTRMLANPKVWRFVRAFGHEWLRLDRHDTIDVNVDLYPDFTRFVKRDMAEETYHFLHRVIAEDLSLDTLVDSDFAMLNQNLAEFYGIEGVAGAHFRPVPVAPEAGRGGLLSQGSFLSGHSDGNQAHPIKRAVWLKEKILGDKPPEPPPNVPDLDPEAPGFERLTLKEQLELPPRQPLLRRLPPQHRSLRHRVRALRRGGTPDRPAPGAPGGRPLGAAGRHRGGRGGRAQGLPHGRPSHRGGPVRDGTPVRLRPGPRRPLRRRGRAGRDPGACPGRRRYHGLRAACDRLQPLVPSPLDAVSQKTWQLDRRTFLRGAGVACALPALEAMTWSQAGGGPDTLPRRLAVVYFPNGCSLPEENDEANAHWRWFPSGEGADYRFTDILASLEPHRPDLSILGGLSHPKSRELLGHLAGDTWLTAGDVRGGEYKNSISLDQVAAAKLKRHTRYPSLVLSTDGGVGYKSRVSTLSFAHGGRPIPAESRPRAIFERYFAPDGGATGEERRRSLRAGKKVVDLVLEDSKRLREVLGAHDREKLEQYLASLNSVEEQIRRNEAWLDVPRKPVDASRLQLDAVAKVDPGAFLDTMFELMVLGLQTDLTRVMTFMMAREDGMGFGDNWPKLALGIDRGHHTISHDKHEGHWDQWGRYDQWVAQRFTHFVDRLSEAEDAHGRLLDTTLVLYGSCCSTTHNARNYPLLLAGGSKLGAQHGRYHRFDETTPLSNLFVSLLNALDVPTETFVDSTGPLPGLFA